MGRLSPTLRPGRVMKCALWTEGVARARVHKDSVIDRGGGRGFKAAGFTLT